PPGPPASGTNALPVSTSPASRPSIASPGRCRHHSARPTFRLDTAIDLILHRRPTSGGSTLGSVLDRHLKTHALFTLKVIDDLEQVPRLRVAFRPEHPHQALCRDVREIAQALKAHRAVDVVPQQRLARAATPGQHAVTSAQR